MYYSNSCNFKQQFLLVVVLEMSAFHSFIFLCSFYGPKWSEIKLSHLLKIVL